MSVLMLINGEREIIRQIVTFTKFYEGLSLPLHPETKATVDSFFGKGGAFVLLCDKVFGKFVDVFYEEEAGMCWMDLANVAPHSPLASALFRCISPGTPFVNFLEAISIPSPTFASRLRDSWKDAQSSSIAGSGEDVTPMYTVDFPLSSFMQGSFRLLAESNEVNLYTFARAKVPSAMLTPFWSPPLVTRKEESTHQVMTSLPCSPLSYFILRLLMYINRRCEKDGAAVLSQRQYNGFRSCIRYCEDTVAWIFNRLPPTEFPFFSGILTAYVQMYVTPSLTKTLAAKVSAEDIQWTAVDATAALLLASSSQLSHRHVAQQHIENNRAAVYEPSQLAPVLSAIPFLTEMHIALHRGIGASREAPDVAVPANFADDATFRAGDDILFIGHMLYRNALISLREAVLSLDGFPRCRFVHFNNILELWLTLMNPLWRINGHVGFSYISRHYEAYSFITLGFLTLATKGTMIAALDQSGVDLFAKCLDQLGEQQFAELADAVHSAGSSSDDAKVLAAVKRSRVLHWTDDDSTFSLMDIHNRDTCNKVAQLYVMIEQKCASEDLDLVNSLFRLCLNGIGKAFPGASEFYDKWRGRGAQHGSADETQPRSYRQSSIDHSIPGTSCCLSEEEKRKFFSGARRSGTRYSEKVRLPTNNGRVHGGHHPVLSTTMRSEFPALIGPTRVLDTVIGRITEAYYSAWIPKCDRWHSMCLVSTDAFSCSNHPHEIGLWECAICETVYGGCCRNLPLTGDGMQLGMKRSMGVSALCRGCGEFFPQGSVCFSSRDDDRRVFCSDCASRPFKPVSTRFLAAYSTWAVVLVIVVMYWYVSGLLFG